ncbi:hypothetical protein [Microvirga massiliensis]|uniref:hypothetical protein n=1 Tax=Microvirga massiliensis TaxID=1033741 RepID=UPI00062B75A8|nr:hypothetical protein [Microvirga massiliensis]
MSKHLPHSDVAALVSERLSRTHEIRQQLALSNVLPSGTSEEMRRAAGLQLMAAFSLFRLSGIPARELGPLRLLTGALEDLDRGLQDPMLRPAALPPGRRQDLTRRWEARANAVVAVEIREALGEPSAVAKRNVVRDFGLSQRTDGKDPVNVLDDWRDRFGRKGAGGAPRDGEHWWTLDECRAELACCQRLDPQGRLDRLKALYEGCLRVARGLEPDRAVATGLRPDLSHHRSCSTAPRRNRRGP